MVADRLVVAPRHAEAIPQTHPTSVQPEKNVHLAAERNAVGSVSGC
jgi:hypothetical protein